MSDKMREALDQILSVQKSISALLEMPAGETELSQSDREMMDGCIYGCAQAMRCLTQPSAQVEAEAVERFWEYLQAQGVVSKTTPSMVYDEYMLALQDCDPVDEVDSYGLWSPRVRQAIKEAFFAGREAGSAAPSIAEKREPSHYVVLDAEGQIEFSMAVDGLPEDQVADMMHEHINDAINGGVEGAKTWVVRAVTGLQRPEPPEVQS